jgi:hypothetical protein
MSKNRRSYAATQVPAYVQVQLELEFGRCPAPWDAIEVSERTAEPEHAIELETCDLAPEVVSDLEHFEFLLKTWGVLEVEA